MNDETPHQNDEEKLEEPTQDATLYPMEQVDDCIEEMKEAVPKLFEITPRVQLIALHYLDETKKTLNSVFDNPSDLANHAIAANLEGYQIGYLLNELKSEMPTTNRLSPGEGVKKEDIARRVRLPLDVDPVKEGDEATEQERQNAETDFDYICKNLTTHWGFPLPLKERSGNGCQGTWRIDLEVGDETDDLIRNVQRCFGKYCGAERYAKVDMSVYLRNQHLKLPGTFSRKGEPTKERPQRLAHFVRGEGQPDNAPFVSREILEAFVAGHADYLQEKYEKQKRAIGETEYRGEKSFEKSYERVKKFCDAFDLEIVKRKKNRDWTNYYLDRCLYQEEREGRTHKKQKDHAWIGIHKDGGIAAGCHRDCQDDYDPTGKFGLKGWEYLKRIADPDYAAEREMQEKAEKTIAKLQKRAKEHAAWKAYVEEIIANQDLSKVFDEAFLTYFLSLPREERASIRQRLYENLRTLDLPAFNEALHKQMNKMECASSEGANDE